MTTITLEDPRAYFDRLARFEAEHWWSRSMWDLASHWLDRFLPTPSACCVDVGCGAGLTLARLADRGDCGEIIGVEPSEEAIAHARSRGTFDVRQGTAQSLPIAAESCDLATCFDVLQHLDQGDDVTAARELARVLRPGGIAVLRTNAEAYRPKDLRRLMRHVGFAIIAATYVNCSGSFLQEIRGRLRPQRFQANPSGAGLPSLRSTGLMRPISRVEAWFVGRWRVTLPFGHSVMLVARK